MSTNLNDFSKVRLIQSGDPVADQIINQPIQALMQQIAALQQQINQISNNNQTANIIPNVPIYSVPSDATNTVVLYDVVYFNASTGLYEKASANVTVINGIFTANPTALGFGVVVAVNGQIANVMVGGFSTWVGGSPSQQTDMLEAGELFTAGVPYYLSAKQPGKITQYPPALRIQILVATNANFIVLPMFSSPESTESLYNVPVGMRPVGSLRTIPSSYSNNVIVGFDGIELYDTVNNVWRSTSQTSASTILPSFGYIVADAVVTTQPPSPIYVRVEVAVGGAITVFSANSFAELYDSEPPAFNVNSGLVSLNSGSEVTVRNYVVQDQAGHSYGTLSFNFTDSDTTYLRNALFVFPDSFQGWKMVNAPIPPSATSVIVSNKVTAVNVVEGSIGYDVAPSVTFTGGGGTGAAATAILNDFGSIVQVAVTSGGSGYTSAPTVVFGDVITGVTVVNGGSGATATASLTAGAISGTAITSAGSGYVTAPNVVVTDSGGTVPGSGAAIIAEVINGAIANLNIISGGTGYTTPILTILPPGNSGYGFSGTTALLFQGGSPGSPATITPTLSSGYVDHIDVICQGGSYETVTTASLTGGGGSGAAIRPVILNGKIIQMIVISPGSGYTGAPTVVLAGMTNGNNAVFNVVIGKSIVGTSGLSAGSGYTSLPTVSAALPVQAVTPANGGSGYVTAPTVGISAPDVSGDTQAAATAYIGSTVSSVVITSGGSLYATTDVISVTGGSPSIAAAFTPVFAGGILVSVQITNPGAGYGSAPTLGVTTSTGSGAALVAIISGAGQVVSIVMTNNGTGYVTPPVVTFSGGSGTGATALAILAGSGAQFQVSMTGSGGLQSAGSTLQIDTYHDDLDNNGVAFPKPNNCAFYYNIKADPNFAIRYPAVPIDKAAFFLNGTELTTSVYSALTQLFADLTADVGLATPTIFWPTFDQNGSPWDQSYTNLISDVVVGGNDSIIPNTGPGGVVTSINVLTGGSGYLTAPTVTFGTGGASATAVISGGVVTNIIVTGGGSGYTATPSITLTGGSGTGATAVAVVSAWWQYWENIFAYEPYQNRAWMSIQQASQFFQSSKVVSLGALAPLQLIDMASGVDVSQDGTPMTGQLLLTLNNQVNILSPASAQINLTTVNSITAIYQNNTGRLVTLSSIILTVVYQQNQSGLIPTAANCASITVGTQAGNYTDFIGSSTADVALTRLFAVNQAKELFPDADSAAPLLQPNEILYLQVVTPAGAPITSQVVVVRVKGNSF